MDGFEGILILFALSIYAVNGRNVFRYAQLKFCNSSGIAKLDYIIRGLTLNFVSSTDEDGGCWVGTRKQCCAWICSIERNCD